MKERDRILLDALDRHRFLSTRQAAEMLELSEPSARREINKLAGSGLIRRVHGGIRILAPGLTPSVPLGRRENWNQTEKRLLCAEALREIGGEHSMMIYGGSTTSFFAEMVHSGRIVTNLPSFCTRLRERFPTGGGPALTLLGGDFDCRTGNLQGAAACRAAENYRCDFGICSAYGMDEQGLLDIDDECTALLVRMMESSDRRIVLADSTKIHRLASSRALPWSKVDRLITVFHPDNHETLTAIRAKGVDVTILAAPVGSDQKKPTSTLF